MNKIKVIAFDLVGVLVAEKDIDLTKEEEKIERLFGSNISDENLFNQEKVRDTLIVNNIISKLYKIKQKDLFKKIKEKYKDIKLLIATNHVSLIRKYIERNMDIDNIDDIIISAEINRIKPDSCFYKFILEKYNIKPNELLFLDDNQSNIDGAKKLGINTIKVEKNMNIIKTIFDFLENVI